MHRMASSTLHSEDPKQTDTNFTQKKLKSQFCFEHSMPDLIRDVIDYVLEVNLD